MTFAKCCFVGAMLLICSSNVLAAEPKCKANPLDYKKITSALKKTDNIVVDSVSCPTIIGNYAQAIFSNKFDGGEAYLIKSKGSWKVVSTGTMIDVDSLISAGFPKDVAEKLTK